MIEDPEKSENAPKKAFFIIQVCRISHLVKDLNMGIVR